jgi:hypothetical protein
MTFKQITVLDVIIYFLLTVFTIPIPQIDFLLSCHVPPFSFQFVIPNAQVDICVKLQHISLLSFTLFA